jgi:hypothetical protein
MKTVQEKEKEQRSKPFLKEEREQMGLKEEEEEEEKVEEKVHEIVIFFLFLSQFYNFNI